MGLVGSGFNRRHIALLRQLSEETGGLIYELRKVDDLTGAVDKISSVMRHQYLLGYSSSNTQNDGVYRKIEVRLNQPTDHPPLRASWRTGYYAPAGE
jgi:Ca-activated chloride channel family protein